MRFWDASAVTPLLVDEPRTGAMTARYDEDRELVVWWGTEIECTSAIARLERAGALEPAQAAAALERLALIREGWHEVTPSTAVRDLAKRLLRVHPLRAADSLQLASAIVAADHATASLPFVCLDDRLMQAATREGFPIVA